MTITQPPISKSRIFAVPFVVVMVALSFWFFMVAGVASLPSDRYISFAIFNLLCFAYFVPTLLAAWTNHKNLVPIAILNMLTGFTGIGWVAALCWCFVNTEGDHSLRIRYSDDASTKSETLEAQLKQTKSEVELLKQEVAELRKRLPQIDDNQS